MVVIAAVAIIATIAVGYYVRARESADTNAVVATLRSINSAQATARLSYGSPMSLPALAERGLLDPTFRTLPNIRNGYRITESGNGGSLVYLAAPLSSATGVRRYRMRISDGLIRYTDTGIDPDDSSTPIGTP